MGAERLNPFGDASPRKSKDQQRNGCSKSKRQGECYGFDANISGCAGKGNSCKNRTRAGHIDEAESKPHEETAACGAAFRSELREFREGFFEQALQRGDKHAQPNNNEEGYS